MKKLIVVSVIFALVASAAFAEAALGGQLMIGTTLLKGDDVENSNVEMGGMQYHEAKMSATFGDAKGGGKLVFTVGNDNAYGGGLGNAWKTAWGFLYWRPLPIFRMQVGVNADGDFGAAQISGWGFTGEAKNSVGAISDYMNWGGGNEWWPTWIFQSALTRRGNAFYPGTGDLANVNFQFFPIDALTITAVLPIGDGIADSGNGNIQNALMQLADFHLNVKYSIEDVGIAQLSFVGKGGLGAETVVESKTELNYWEEEETIETVRTKTYDKSNSIGNIYASFYLTAIAGMNMELGLVYGLPWTSPSEIVEDKKTGEDVEIGKLENDGYLGIGIGYRLDNGGPFTFKTRINARFGGKKGVLHEVVDSDGKVELNANGTKKTKVTDMNTVVYAHVLPCYKITNDLWAFLYAGMSMEMFELYDGARIGWFVNPYIWVRAAEGLRFWAGVQVYQDGRRIDKFGASDDAALTWRVPFGFNFYF